jgi:hypothetical protein
VEKEESGIRVAEVGAEEELMADAGDVSLVAAGDTKGGASKRVVRHLLDGSLGLGRGLTVTAEGAEDNGEVGAGTGISGRGFDESGAIAGKGIQVFGYEGVHSEHAASLAGRESRKRSRHLP